MDYLRILDLEYPDPHRNLAVEEVLLIMIEKGRSPETIRFWRNPNTIVIGRFQDVGLEVDLEACRRFGTNIARRITGGGAVYQDDGNLNWTVAMRRGHPGLPRDLTGIFRVFGRMVSEGIGAMGGVDIQFSPPNNISIDGMKISGMAAYIKSRALLCHGTLLVDTDLERLRALLKKPHTTTSPSSSINYTRSRWVEVTNLSLAMEREVSIEGVKKNLLGGLHHLFPHRIFAEEGLSEEEEGLIEELLQEKYRTIAWNLDH